MPASDIPTSFGFPAFLRIFLPGFLGSTIYLFAILPYFDQYFDELNVFSLIPSLTSLGEIIFWLLIVTIFGIMITSIDFYIYQFYEGLRFWKPKLIWEMFFAKTVEKFLALEQTRKDLNRNINVHSNNLIDANYQINLLKEKKNTYQIALSKENKNSIMNKDMICDEIDAEIKKYNIEKQKLVTELLELENELSKILYSLEEYPFDEDLGEKYPRNPTRFGNVIAAYETYSDMQYGMNMLVFWQHISIILPKDARDELDMKGAISDMFVYISFFFLTYIPLGGTLLTFNLNADFNKIFIKFLMVPNWLSSIILFLIISAISLTFFLLFYELAVVSLINYGRLVKATFDIYRIDLAEKFGINISLAPDIDEKNLWEQYGDFLLTHSIGQLIKDIKIKNEPPKFNPPIKE